ncbi:MAG: DUF4957 domain-containing protein [Bacteroidaceae bacterium]|nr:DUF4957 domain-containing protein [Bacteroidaceae bacterium]
MKKINKYLWLFIASVLVGAIFSACKDDEDLAKADALFRPIINTDDDVVLGLTPENVPYVTVEWDKFKDANQYEVSLKSTDGKDDRVVVVDTNFVRFDNLQYDTDYNIGVKSMNTVTGLQSKAYNFTVTTADFPTNLSNISTSDVIDTQVRVKWMPGVVYDSLAILKDSDGSFVKGVTVTEEDNAAHSKIVTGLDPKTSYRVLAYIGNFYQGKKRFTTTAAESYDGVVFDLRDMDAKESLKWINSDNIDSLVRENPDQNINIVLQGGMNYRLETVKLPSTKGTIKFVTGLSLQGNAIWNVTGNFDLPADVDIAGVTFEKIEFTDDESKPRSSGNFGGTYLFNPQSNARMGTLTIKSCVVRYKRGVLRIRSTNVVDNVVIDDCIFEYIGGYGITNVDNGDAAIHNIKVSNSTFANCVRMFVNTKNKSAGCTQSVDIRNCTFVYFSQPSRGIIELQDDEIPGGITMKNCLFGPAGELYNKGDVGEGATGIKGWTGAVAPTASDIYYTSDFVKRMNAEGTDVDNYIEGTVLSTDVTGTFLKPNPGVDAEGNPTLDPGDYTLISDEANKVKAGDPRWLK